MRNVQWFWPEDVRDWTGLWIESVGRRGCTSPVITPHPNFHCMHLVLRGQVRLTHDTGAEWLAGPGDIMSLWSGCGHRFQAHQPRRAHEIDMEWVRLRGPLTRPFMRTFGVTEDKPCRPADDPAKAGRLFRELCNLARHYTPAADVGAMSLLYQLVEACGYHRQAVASPRSLAERVHEAMQTQLETGMNIEGFARAFGVSRSLLFLEFKKHLGISPVKELNRLRIARAKKLLSETSLSIADVAAACGDSNPMYFSRRFREATGVSPSDFRARGTD